MGEFRYNKKIELGGEIIMNPNFDVAYMTQVIPMLSKYIYLTLSLAVISMAAGLAIALSLLAVGTYKVKVLNGLSKLYISFLRGTPLLVQLFLLYYGLPQIMPVFKNVSAFYAAIIGLSMNGSAYMVAIPSLGNTFVDLLKSSSLAFTLGVAEILAQAQMSAAATYKFFENYMAVALIYWGIVVFFNLIQKLLEKKLGHAY